MIAQAVIGANMGDEGKGLITAALCAPYADDCLNIRFNSSAQAGHTVEHEGRRHVFHHFGSGSFTGAHTFLSRFFYSHPMLFRKERKDLPGAMVFIDQLSPLVTPYDVMLNHAIEAKRGNDRHGSCGVGFGEAVERTECGFGILTGNLIYGADIRLQLNLIRNVYLPRRIAELGVSIPSDLLHNKGIIDSFLEDCQYMADECSISVRNVAYSRYVFEGAQGLGLDQTQGHFPHVTRSNTGLANAMRLAGVMGLDIEPVYVTRTYLTRHGAGPMESEDLDMSFKDDTNVSNEHQGALRFGPLDTDAMFARIACDLDLNLSPSIKKPRLAITCNDQHPFPEIDSEYMETAISSHGPRIADVYFP